MSKKSITVLIDFDDTITTTNIAHIVLSEFAEPNWPEIRQQFIRGEIPPEGYFETPFEIIVSPIDPLSTVELQPISTLSSIITLPN